MIDFFEIDHKIRTKKKTLSELFLSDQPGPPPPPLLTKIPGSAHGYFGHILVTLFCQENAKISTGR